MEDEDPELLAELRKLQLSDDAAPAMDPEFAKMVTAHRGCSPFASSSIDRGAQKRSKISTRFPILLE